MGIADPKSLLENQDIDFNARKFWLKYLRNGLPSSNLPYDKGTIRGSESDTIEYKIEGKLYERIVHITNGSDSKFFAVLCSGLLVILQKYIQCNDVLVSLPFNFEETSIVNILPLKVTVDCDVRVQDFIISVDSLINEIKSRKNDRIEDIIKQITNSDKLDNLHNIGICMENCQMSTDLVKTPYKTSFYFCHKEKAILGKVNFNTLIYSHETISKLIDRYLYVLEFLANNTSSQINEFKLLTAEDQKDLLKIVNNTQQDYCNSANICDVFNQQVINYPNKTAIVNDNQRLTYKELDEKSGRFAAMLKANGVVNNSIVPIILDPCFEMAIIILGVIKSGGVYLPIDPNTPSKRIEYILDDCKAEFLILHSDDYSKNIDIKCKKIITFNLDDVNFFEPLLYNSLTIPSSNYLYIIYTSGSDGTPKGVVIAHRNIINYTNWFTTFVKVKSSDNGVLSSSLDFDMTYTLFYSILLNGGELHIIPKKKYTSPNYLLQYIKNNKISILKLTPSLFNQLLCTTNVRADIFSNLRTLVFGGENICIYDIKRFNKLCPDIIIMSEYGSTETTIGSIATIIDIKKLDKNNSFNNIGRPISNTQLYIVGQNNEVLPIGFTGELCLSGDNVSIGYLDKPQLNCEKFIKNQITQGLIFKTGDLAKILTDGTVELYDRIDNQVNINGYRIELEEIESCLMSFDNISVASVNLYKTDNRNSFLYAYLELTERTDVLDIITHIEEKLPEYMIPSVFIELQKIPLTANVKTNKKELPDPIYINPEQYYKKYLFNSKNQVNNNLNNTEVAIIETISKLLNIEQSRISRTSDFFELGGNSINAALLSLSLTKALRIEVPLNEIFNNPMVKDLARFINSGKKAKSIQLSEKKEYYPLSSAQKRLYIINQLDPKSLAYNLHQYFEVQGEVDIELMKEVFGKIILRHDVLRTSIELISNVPYQKILNDIHFDIPEIRYNVKNVSGILNDLVRPFDISKPPFFRVEIIRNVENKAFLFFDMHHIISDAVSLDLLRDEFIKLYHNIELPALSFQYKEYAVLQNCISFKKRIKLQEQFWIHQFEDDIPIIDLPSDYQRPKVNSFEGDYLESIIDIEQLKKLNILAKENGATLYMVLLSAYNVWLMHLTGQEDIIIGSPIFGRNYPGFESIIGMFVNTLSLRNKPEGNKSFIQFLEEVKNNTILAYGNQEYQFDDLVDHLSIDRDMSRNPLFDVMFVLNNTDSQNLDLLSSSFSDFELKDIDRTSYFSKFDLTLSVSFDNQGLNCKLIYWTKLFKHDTIKKYFSYFNSIITCILQNPNDRIGDLDFIPSNEKNELISANTSSILPVQNNKTIGQLFKDQVRKSPSSNALQFNNQILTYNDLDVKSDKLATHLKKLGVTQNSAVGILVEPSIDMVVGIISIIKLGAVFVPIDSNNPDNRIDYILKDSNIQFLIKQFNLNQHLRPGIITVSIDSDDIYEQPHEPVRFDHITIDNPLYIIYTSGSTGMPKGVLISHKNIINYANWFTKTTNFTHNDKSILTTSYAFDLIYTQFFAAMLNGGEMHVLPKIVYQSPDKLIDYFEENKITFLKLTPSLFNLILNNDNFSANKFKSVRFLILGGEKLNIQDVLRFHSLCLHTKIMNHYGPTETTIGTVATILEPEKLKNDDVFNTIGKPISNAYAYVLNKYNKLVPIGVKGELSIGGNGVSKGYINKIDLTNDKFIVDPYREGKIYKTGDVARILANGNIEFFGRIDNQVKVRGYRIELGEIEKQILSLAKVNDVTVVLICKENDKYLIAYYVAKELVSGDEIKSFLLNSLPEYMVPSMYVQLEKLPLTINGKINRRELPEPIFKDDIKHVAPNNEIEIVLLRLWGNVLGIDKGKISVHSDFFKLGGHSLKAIQLISLINKELTANITLRDIFHNPTIRGIYSMIKTNILSVTNVKTVEKKEYYQLSSAQKRLFALNQRDLLSLDYNLTSATKILGKFDKTAFEDALIKLLERHNSLRTSFHILNDEPVQIVHNKCEFGIEYFSASEGQINQIIKAFIKPFDLSHAPLFRMGIITVKNDMHVMIMDMHHIITDHISSNILTKEIIQLYLNKPLEPLDLTYVDFVNWQQRTNDNENIKNQENYWVKKFSNLPVNLNLPFDYVKPEIESSKGDSVTFQFEEDLNSSIEQFCTKNSTTQYSLILSLIYILLNKYTNQVDIVVGTPTVGRANINLDRIIGFFINTLPMRVVFDENMSFKELLDMVKQNTIDVIENSDYQIENIVSKLKISDYSKKNPLFDVVFNYLDISDHDFSELPFEISPIDLAINSVPFNLEINAGSDSKGIYFTFSYSTDLFRKSTIEKMVNSFKEIVAQVVNDENIVIKDIQIASDIGRIELSPERLDKIDFEF